MDYEAKARKAALRVWENDTVMPTREEFLEMAGPIIAAAIREAVEGAVEEERRFHREAAR